MSKVKKKTSSLSTSMFVEQLMMNSSYDSFGKKISVSQTPAESALDSPKAPESKEKKKASKVKKSASNLETFQNSSSSKHSVSGNLVSSEGAQDDSGSTSSKKSRHHKKEAPEEAGEGGGTAAGSSTSEASSGHAKLKKSSKHHGSSTVSASEHGDEPKKGKSETAVGDPAVSTPTSTPTKTKLFSKRRSLAQSGPNNGAPQQLQGTGEGQGSDGSGGGSGAQQSSGAKKDEMKLYYDKHSTSKDDDSDSGDDYYFDAMGDVIDDDHHRAPLGYETVVKMDGWIRKTFTDKSNRRKERKERDSFESERGSEHSKKTIIPNIFLLKKKKEKGTKHKKSGSGVSDDVSVCTDDSSDISQPVRSLSQPPVLPGFGNDLSVASNAHTADYTEPNNDDNNNNGNNSTWKNENEAKEDNDEENKQVMMMMIDSQKREQASRHLRHMVRRSHATAGRLAQLERRVGAAEACMPGKARDDVFAVCKSLDESASELREFMDGMEFEKFMEEQRKELAQTEESVAALVAECEALEARARGNDRRARVLRMSMREFNERAKDSWSEKVLGAVSWMFSGVRVDLSYNSKVVCGPSVSLLRKWFKLF